MFPPRICLLSPKDFWYAVYIIWYAYMYGCPWVTRPWTHPLWGLFVIFLANTGHVPPAHQIWSAYLFRRYCSGLEWKWLLYQWCPKLVHWSWVWKTLQLRVVCLSFILGDTLRKSADIAGALRKKETTLKHYGSGVTLRKLA